MKRAIRRAKILAVTAGIVLVGSAPGQAADRSQAMEQHMRLMAEQNPGMARMMELMEAGNPGMEAMMRTHPFEMPPTHP